MKKKVVSGYPLIFGYLGIFFIVSGFICILPLVMLIAYPSESAYAHYFYLPGLISIAIGIILTFSFLYKKEKSRLGKHQDTILLVLVWLIAIIVGSIPFMFRGMDFTASIFESTSGFSATGLSRFDFSSDIAPYTYKFYRSLLLFFGGVGLVLIVASAISDRYGLKLYVAEGHNDRLVPNLAKSARVILGIYTGYIILGISAYCIAGMSFYDALNHSFAAVATGGFSTYSQGLADPALLASLRYGDASLVAVEVISMVLMVLGGTNFLLHLLLLRGKVKKVFKDCEIRFFGLMCLIFIPLFTVSILLHLDITDGNFDFLYSLRTGSFIFVSAITTTGFANVVDIAVLGQGLLFMTIIMMIVGGGLGSTAGAIKQYRVVIAFKSMYWSIRDRMSPKALIHPHDVNRYGELKEITKDDSFEAFSYSLLYLVVLGVGAIGLTLFSVSNKDITFGHAFFEFSSALSGTGLSVVSMGDATTGFDWVLIIGMFAGRLELLALYFAFYRIIRDILRKETI